MVCSARHEYRAARATHRRATSVNDVYTGREGVKWGVGGWRREGNLGDGGYCWQTLQQHRAWGLGYESGAPVPSL